MALSNYNQTLQPPLKTLPSSALRAVFKEGYSSKDFACDILSGIVVGIVALPLAMALAIGVGVPPQYGLYTAIIAGGIVPLLGGSRFQITGPTAAFIVILAPIYSNFGLGGLLFSGLLAGVILVTIGVARLGKFIQFIPHSVTTGFTAGIGTVIAFYQIKDFLGLQIEKSPNSFIDKLKMTWAAFPTFQIQEFGTGLGTLILLLLIPKITKKIPAPLIALSLAGIGIALLRYFDPGLEVATIGSRFHTVIFGKEFAGIPQILPQFATPWSLVGVGGRSIELSFETIRILFSSAFAVAVLGAIESLLSAMIADGMAGTKHDPDSELIAIGIGNILCPFFGGIPATGAIARTATNIRYGGKSPLSGFFHALFILVSILVAAPLLSYLPMASLAALLLIVAWNMSDVKHFNHILQVAPKGEIFILLTCYFLTVIFDMVTSVFVGVTLASFIFMQRMASISRVQLIADDHPSLNIKLPSGVMLYEVAGPLFFAAAETAMGTLRRLAGQTKAIIFDMRGVPIMDETGLVAFENAVIRLRKQGIFVLVSELQKQPHDLFRKSFDKSSMSSDSHPIICADIKRALMKIQELGLS